MHTRARALPLSKSGLRSGVGYFQFYVKYTATAPPAIGKFIQKRAAKSPSVSRLPASQPACTTLQPPPPPPPQQQQQQHRVGSGIAGWQVRGRRALRLSWQPDRRR